MLVVVFEAVDEAWAVGGGWLAQQGLDQTVLHLPLVLEIVFHQQREFSHLLKHLIPSHPFQQPRPITPFIFIKIIFLHALIMHLSFVDLSQINKLKEK